MRVVAYGFIVLRVVRVMNHGMYRVMVVGIWIYSMVCDIKETVTVYDIIEMVTVYGIESGGYGLGISDGMWWWYMKNSEGILYVIYGRYIVWN